MNMQLLDFAYIAVYALALYSAIVWLLVFASNRSGLTKHPKVRRTPSITFLIPAYNEERNIARCVQSIRGLDYPQDKIRIIVIDDGSTDGTAKIAKRMSGIRLLTQERGGKAAAMNRGLKIADTELLACLDADSYMDKEYLRRAVGYMERSDVAAVTPSLKVAGRDNLIQKIQHMEYLFSVFLRKMFAIFDCQYVVPGPGGIYRTSTIKSVGGFDERSMTEDMEIAFRFIDRGYRLENSMNAYVYTETPRGFVGMYRQRLRWYRGYIQVVKKYWHMVGNLKFGNLGVFLLPINFAWIVALGFMFFVPLYKILSDAVGMLVNWSLIGYTLLPIRISLNTFLNFYTGFVAMFAVFSVATIYISVRCADEATDLRRNLLDYIGFIFIYPFLISIFWIAAVVYEVFGVGRKW